MKKYLRYGLMALVVLFFGAESSGGKDIGKLQPVQVVCMSRIGDELLLQTDTGDQGRGHTPQEALADMKSAAAGEIFLDTAEFLLLTPDCLDILDEMGAVLRPSCSLCLMEGEPNLEQIGQFLALHTPKLTLMEYRAEPGQLQTLKTTDGRMTLVSRKNT